MASFGAIIYPTIYHCYNGRNIYGHRKPVTRVVPSIPSNAITVSVIANTYYQDADGDGFGNPGPIGSKLYTSFRLCKSIIRIVMTTITRCTPAQRNTLNGLQMIIVMAR